MIHTAFAINGEAYNLGLSIDPSLSLSEYLKRFTPFKVTKACLTGTTCTAQELEPILSCRERYRVAKAVAELAASRSSNLPRKASVSQLMIWICQAAAAEAGS